MRTLLILQNELKIFFYTPLAYIMAFAFYSVNGILFWYCVNQANQPGEQLEGSIMSHITGGIVFWFMLFILVPVLSMRLIAYETERRTMSQWFTAPIATWEITLGKYLGGLSFYLLLWLPTLLYYGILRAYSDVDSGPVVSAYLGLFLVGAFTLALGMVTSTVALTQITAAVLCFTFLIALLLLSMFETLLADSLLKEVFRYLNFVDHFTPFTEGLIDSRAVVFFTLGTVFCLCLANEILDIRRHRHG